MMARTSSTIMQDWWKLNNAPRCEVTKCLLFLCHAYAIQPLWCVVELLPQDMASAFVGRFRRCLQRIFPE